MFHIRQVETASGATAIQVISYRNRKRIIAKHIGSARKREDISALKELAYAWVKNAMQQTQLFPDERDSAPVVSMAKLKNLGSQPMFAREVLETVISRFAFPGSMPDLFRDMVIMRIIHPTSKRESLELLTEYFGRTYRRGDWYTKIPVILAQKAAVERSMVAFAREHFGFDFSVVFYDVTTLYFESMTSDTLKTTGFSKDNKSTQPQIVLGLIVSREGFPVAYDIFPGKTFEGNTFIPIICQFRDANHVSALTVVADAAMISQKNIDELSSRTLRYIVGARVANLTRTQIKTISTTLHQQDGVTMRLETKRGLLVLDFSVSRFRKDQRDMDKQVTKAETFVTTKQTGRHTKFIRYTRKATQALNTALIEKTKLLLGIKGYYTNCTDQSDDTIVRQYHNLWHVEAAFRIAKSDLAIRPIYHFKEQTVKAHILLCFMALAVCTYMEYRTGKSTKYIIKKLMRITDVTLLDTLSGQTHTLRMEIPTETRVLVTKLVSH